MLWRQSVIFQRLRFILCSIKIGAIFTSCELRMTISVTLLCGKVCLNLYWQTSYFQPHRLLDISLQFSQIVVYYFVYSLCQLHYIRLLACILMPKMTSSRRYYVHSTLNSQRGCFCRPPIHFVDTAVGSKCHGYSPQLHPLQECCLSLRV